MKKAFLLLSVSALILASCQTTTKTAKTTDVQSDIKSITVADLKVSEERVTTTMAPVGKDLRRGGDKAVLHAVEAKALEENGGADVLVEPRYVMSKKKGLFGSKITSVTVSGRPAWYRNIRTLNDSVWNNPTFRGLTPMRAAHPQASKSNRTKGSSDGAFRKPGWAGFINLYYGGGDVDIENWDTDINSSFLVSVGYGYQFNPYIYLGLGLGYLNNNVKDGMNSMEYLPIFYDLRLNATKKKNTPFLDMKLGSVVPLGNLRDDLDKSKQSLFVMPSVGYSFGRVDVAAFYQHTLFKGEYKFGSDYTETTKYQTNTWGINIGLRF